MARVSRWDPQRSAQRGKRRCQDWVVARLEHSMHNVYLAMERHACRSSLCDARFEHARQDIADAKKALASGKCDEVIITCEHLDMIAKKRD